MYCLPSNTVSTKNEISANTHAQYPEPEPEAVMNVPFSNAQDMANSYESLKSNSLGSYNFSYPITDEANFSTNFTSIIPVVLNDRARINAMDDSGSSISCISDRFVDPTQTAPSTLNPVVLE